MILGELSALVLTALPVEMAAVLARLDGDRSSMLVGPVLCELGHFTASGGRSWRVVAAELGPGTVEVAAAVAALTAHFQPDVLMFAGIAGALTDDVAIGDVVAGTEVAWTERGKWAPGGYQARIRTVSLSAPLSQLSRKIAREGSWKGRLTRPRPGAKAVVAQIACGEKVVADADYRAWLRATFSDAVAIENEGFALARAGEVHAHGQRYVVRGISDNVDGTKSDHGHADAADAAAAFAFELLNAYSAQVIASSAAPATIAARRADQGDKLCGTHRYAAAEAEYRAALALDPVLARAHAGLGRALHMRLAYAEAEAASREAIRLDPSRSVAHANLGRTLANLGRRAEAEAACREAIRIDPGCAIAHANLGRVLGDLARYPEAEVACREAVRLDPALTTARADLGDVLYRQRRYAAAEAAYREATRLDPSYPIAHARLGRVLGDLARYPEAEAACREAVRLDPALAVARADLGDVLYRQRRYAAAEAAYRQAAYLDEGDAYAREGLGETLSRQGRHAEAAAAYSEALGLDPGNEHAREALASALGLQEGQGTRGPEMNG